MRRLRVSLNSGERSRKLALLETAVFQAKAGDLSSSKLYVMGEVAERWLELGEHDKETEIENAMRGQHIFDGFLLHRERNQAKQVVDEILGRLNRGESVDPNAIRETLQPFLA